MRFSTMYKKLEDIAGTYNKSMSNVITMWDVVTNKKMRRYTSFANDDLAIINNQRNQYDVCREEAINVIDRYYRRELNRRP